MNSPRNPYAHKVAILGILIVIIGVFAFVSLIRAAGKVILIVVAVIVVGVIASKINNSGEDKSQPKHVKSTRSDNGVSKAFSKWWHS